MASVVDRGEAGFTRQRDRPGGSKQPSYNLPFFDLPGSIFLSITVESASSANEDLEKKNRFNNTWLSCNVTMPAGFTRTLELRLTDLDQAQNKFPVKITFRIQVNFYKTLAHLSMNGKSKTLHLKERI